MDRVKDYICFAVWFIGLSYVALWPMAVPDSVVTWLTPQAPAPRACGGLVVASLQELCRAHETVALSPGLHAIGMLAAFWVTARLMLLLLLRLARLLVPRAVQDLLSPARMHVVLRRPLTLLMRHRSRQPASPRYVPRRREFGLRGPSR
jgi:hypothetical protein